MEYEGSNALANELTGFCLGSSDVREKGGYIHINIYKHNTYVRTHTYTY